MNKGLVFLGGEVCKLRALSDFNLSLRLISREHVYYLDGSPSLYVESASFD
jgi:hypothetical protein